MLPMLFLIFFSCTSSQNAFIQVAKDLAIYCSCNVPAKQVVFVCPAKPADRNALTNTLNNTFLGREKKCY